MYVTSPSVLINDYAPKHDKGSLDWVLSLLPGSQEFVEITSRVITFADSYLTPYNEVEITAAQGTVFTPETALNILSISPKYFGDREMLESIITQETITAGISLAAIPYDALTPVNLERTFSQLYDEDVLGIMPAA